jgi:cytochrome c
MKTKLAVSATAALLLSGGAPAAFAVEMPELAIKSGCPFCHRIERKLVGPAWREVSNKYRGNANAAQKLVESITRGSRNWLGYFPMAPNNVSYPDAMTLATFIVSLSGLRDPSLSASLLSPSLSAVTVPPDPGQCVTYHPSRKPQVQIPCVQVGDGVVYAAGLNEIPAPAGGLRFEVDPSSVQQVNTIPTENCAVLPLAVISRLYITCLDLGTDKPWVMLDLSNVDPMTFDFVEFGTTEP